MRKFNTLLIDSDTSTRSTLSQACSEVIDFGEFHFYRTLENGLAVLADKDILINVVFVSVKFDEDSIIDFLQRATNTINGERCTFISLCTPPYTKETDKKKALPGFLGSIQAPFSIEALTQLTRSSDSARQAIEQKKLEDNIRRIISETSTLLKVVAKLQSSGYTAELQKQQLKSLGEKIKSLHKTQKTKYFEILIEIFSTTPSPEVLPDRFNYSGASTRLKKRFKNEIISELKKNS
jgi:hypothetical protein